MTSYVPSQNTGCATLQLESTGNHRVIMESQLTDADGNHVLLMDDVVSRKVYEWTAITNMTANFSFDTSYVFQWPVTQVGGVDRISNVMAALDRTFRRNAVTDGMQYRVYMGNHANLCGGNTACASADRRKKRVSCVREHRL